MMEAVHRYEGTVNQVMGDGIMALFGAPIAHEDDAIRACYAALRMQEAVKRYAKGVRQAEGGLVQIRVGLNSGEVVVRSIGSDLHMDYAAVGQTTHVAARMEQMALPGSILLPAETLQLAEGYVDVRGLAQLPQFEGVRYRILGTYRKSRHYTEVVWVSVGGRRKRSGRSRPSRSRRAAWAASGRTTHRRRSSRPSWVGSTTSVLWMHRSSSRIVRGLRPSPARCCHCSRVFHRT